MMEDTASASIEIMGTFGDADAMEALCAALIDDECSLDGYTDPISFNDALAAALQAIAKGEALKAYRSCAPDGELAEVELTCRELGLTYERVTDGDLGVDAETVSWTPGDGDVRKYPGREEANIPAKEVLGAINAGADAVADLKAKVERLLGIGIPKRLRASPETLAEIESRSSAPTGPGA